MELKAISGADERIAISALCLQRETLQAVAPNFPTDPFASRWANLVAMWCVRHYQNHQDAPGPGGITALYADWASTADKDTAAIIGRFLGSLDANAVPNSGYAVELIRKLILKTSIKNLSDKLSGALSNGKVEEALALAEGWGRPQVAEELEATYPLLDDAALDAAFNYTAAESLIQYKGALGQFFGPMLSRDSFVGVQGAAKRGKSTWLIDMVWKAVVQGRRVAHFNIGDLSEGQFLVRLMPKACKMPKGPGTYRIPTSLVFKDKEPVLEYKVRSYVDGFTREQGKQALMDKAGEDGKRFRLVSRPAGSMTVGDITTMCRRWADSGWVPDVISVDYIDILGPNTAIREVRDQINDKWLKLRALSTELHCLVLGATQADTEGYTAWLLEQKNFNGDRRINDHVSGIIGINQTPLEKRAGVTRLNWPTLREQEFMDQNPGTVVAAAGCMSLGSPSIISTWL